nr:MULTISPECIES: reverse transcriptase domain-containing protein [unclassified Photorhabdus]
MILKEDGTERPLSILCLENKIVQQAAVTVLNQIYETDFLGFSYGFRPGRGQHDALRRAECGNNGEESQLGAGSGHQSVLRYRGA